MTGSPSSARWSRMMSISMCRGHPCRSTMINTIFRINLICLMLFLASLSVSLVVYISLCLLIPMLTLPHISGHTLCTLRILFTLYTAWKVYIKDFNSKLRLFYMYNAITFSIHVNLFTIITEWTIYWSSIQLNVFGWLSITASHAWPWNFHLDFELKLPVHCFVRSL